MSRRFAVALLLGALALAPGFASAEEDTSSLEQIVVETAHTKAEHQALAHHFAEQAAEARKMSQRHESMARAYLGSKSMNKQALRNHCNHIAEQQEAIAKDYDALAKLHEDEAKQAK
jgi:hypothetical protein